MSKINVTIFAEEHQILGYDKNGIPDTKIVGHTQFVIEVDEKVMDDIDLFQDTVNELLGNESDDFLVYRYFNHSHGLFLPRNLTKEFNYFYEKLNAEIETPV